MVLKRWMQRDRKRGEAFNPFEIRNTLIRRQTIRWLTGACIFLVVVGYATNKALEESLKDILVKSLHTILVSESTALEIWLDTQRNKTQLWSTAVGLEEPVQALLENPPKPGVLAEQQRSLNSDIRRALSGIEYSVGFILFAVLDRGGKVLASNSQELVGAHISSDLMAPLTRVFADGVHVSKPILITELQAQKPLEKPTPIIFSGAAIVGPEEQAEAEAALVALTDPGEEFTRILNLASLGQTGKTFAFDETGKLLNHTLYDSDLRELGLLPEDPSVGSLLFLEARDPGGNLTKGYEPETLPRERPLTRSVAAAIDTKQPGYQLHSYRDFRGVQVVGAWDWLEDHQIGLVTELDMTEIRAVILPLKLSFGALYALIVVLTLFLIYRFYFARKLRAHLEKIRLLGQYELLAKIDEGGMGAIYRARHAFLSRPTVIKLIKGDEVNEEDLARFEREVQMASALTHPNTIEVYDFGRTSEGVFYYAMEYLNGISFARLIETEGSVPAARAIYLLRQLLGSLREAHEQGLIHRDIKPRNLFICQRGGLYDFVKVLDFGLVKSLYAEEAEFNTSLHVLAGTPHYIAPERLRNPQYLDPRSDLYSVGVVAFNLLTGEQPFDSANQKDLIERVLGEQTVAPSRRLNGELPEALDRLVLDLLARNPEDRPRGAGEVLRRLDEIQTPDRWGEREAADWGRRHAEWFAMPTDEGVEEPSRTREYVMSNSRR